jgi:pheromone shutdown protein TraB
LPVIKSQQKQISGFTSMLSGWASKLGGIILGKALGQFYGSIEKLGFTTGGEFKAAIEEGNAIGAKILLGDRDVEVTLQRLAKAISLTDADSFNRLGDRLENLQDSIGLKDLDTIIENKQQALSVIERMKQRDTLNTMLSAVKEEVPLVYSALIGERDEFMAEAIANAKGKVLVGVVGMAHMSGIEKFLIQKGYSVVKRNCPTNPKLI